MAAVARPAQHGCGRGPYTCTYIMYHVPIYMYLYACTYIHVPICMYLYGQAALGQQGGCGCWAGDCWRWRWTCHQTSRADYCLSEPAKKVHVYRYTHVHVQVHVSCHQTRGPIAVHVYRYMYIGTCI